MVDSISKSGGSPIIKRPGDDATARLQGNQVGVSTSTSQGAGDTASLSAAATQMPAELKGGAPVDLPIVSKLQEAIASGNYPIDLDAITESLFQSYMELNS